MIWQKKDLLVLGYGNPMRGDDGLGPLFVEKISSMNLPGVETDSNYQLVIEDACNISEYKRVLFVDATMDGPSPFTVREILSSAAETKQTALSSHSSSPEEIVAVARELFGVKLCAHIMAIRGFCFEEFKETLSPEAERNMLLAVDFFVNKWLNRS